MILRTWIWFYLFGLIPLCHQQHHNTHIKPGRSGIVTLFQWTYQDIAIECEQHLGPFGYGGVEVFTYI